MANIPASWVLRDDDRPAGTLFHGSLNDAAEQASGARVSVLVPGADVLLAQVELPAMKAQRLVKAVPFALEDHLAEDVDDLHVAIGQRDAQGKVANAVVSRTRLDAWLAILKAAGLQADVVTPELFGVHWEASNDSTGGDASETAAGDESGQVHWSMLIDGQAGLLRTGAQTGLAFDMSNLISVIQANIVDAGDFLPAHLWLTLCGGANVGVGDDPSSTNTFADSEQHQALAALCTEQGIELSLDTEGEARGIALAQGFDEQHAINLLQGDYSRKEQLEKLFRPWRPTLMLAGAWLLLQVGMLTVEYNQLSSHDDALKEQIEAVYRDAFPQSRNIVNPKVQMQRGLDKLRGDGGQSDGLLPLIAKMGAVLKDTPGASLRTLRYKKNKLDVDIDIPDLQSLDKLKQRLSTEANLSVEIVSASSREGKVESRLSLKATGGSQ